MTTVQVECGRFTMIEILRIEAALTRQSGQKLDELIAEQIDMLAATTERWNCTTPDQLKEALRLELSQRELVRYPSVN